MNIQRALDFSSNICYSTRETLLNTIMTTHMVLDNNIPGDFVELGVAAGAQVIVAAAVLDTRGSDKKIFYFDSFEGISMASHHDTVQAGIGPVNFTEPVPVEDTLKSSGVTAVPLEDVKKNIINAGVDISRFVFIKGWIEKTLYQGSLYQSKINKICWYRTDVDQYYPTHYGIKALWKKISKGAPVIIDDWELDGARKAVGEHLREVYGDDQPRMISIPGSTPKWFVKR